MSRTIQFEGSREELHSFLSGFPSILSGAAGSQQEREAAEQVAIAVGNTLLGDIKEDFIRKSEGAQGQDGITWSPLMPATIRAKAKKALAAKGMSPKSAKGAAYRGRLAEYNKRLSAAKQKIGQSISPAPAGNKPAQAARLKTIERLARTAVGTFPHEIRSDVDKVRPFALTLILRDTGVLLNSLSAGVRYQRYTGPNADQQIFIAKPGEVIVGTNVPYASKHQHGDKSQHLPKRQILPKEGQVPATWWSNVKATAAGAIADALVFLLQGGRR